MRRIVRFLVGAGVGGGALAGYLAYVGVDSVVAQLSAVATGVLAAVACLVVAEGVVDGIGVWASVRPLGDGLSGGQSVQFALAGDFFDTLSPAGPVSSEPIMARFISVTTETGYSDALAVRSVAKYVKSATQVGLSTVGAVALVTVGPAPRSLLVTLGGAVVAIAGLGVALVGFRRPLAAALAAVLGPVVRLVSSLSRKEPRGRTAVADALDRFVERVVRFRAAPGLLGLIAVGGVCEQLLTAAALWVALAGTSGTVTATAYLPLLVVVPLPQAASVVPVPGSLGAYDLLLGGAVALSVGVDPASAAAAVLVVRTLALAVSVAVGGVAVTFLRGWRP